MIYDSRLGDRSWGGHAPRNFSTSVFTFPDPPLEYINALLVYGNSVRWGSPRYYTDDYATNIGDVEPF